MKLVKPYLALMVLVWLPWGLVCIFNLSPIETIIGVTGTPGDGASDMRAMYGGVQTGVGFMAALALYRPKHLQHALFGLACLGTCMAFARTYGLITDGPHTFYTWGVIAFEAFAGLAAIALLRGSNATGA